MQIGWNRGRTDLSDRALGAAHIEAEVAPRHRDDIQGLRAVAVLLVALDHAGVTFLTGGFVGVDVFFVLSGFLITGLLLAEARRRRWVSLADFYMRRARRILPAAVLTILVTDIAAYHLLNIVRAKQTLLDSIPSLFFVANIHFAAQGTDYFAQGQPPSPLQHFWSLAVEEQFYIVWPALFILLLGLALSRYAERPPHVRDGAVRRVLIVVAAVAVGSLVWSIHYTQAQPAAAYFSSPARAWELALGATLALGASRLGWLRPGWHTAMGWGGLACIAIAAVSFSAGTPFPGYAALLPTIGAALLLAAGATRSPTRRAPGRLLALAPLRYIGDRSYAFYLWHWPVLVIAAQHAGHSLSVGENLLLLLAAFVLSIVSYRLVEAPIRSAHWARRPQPLLFAVVVPGLVVVALATAWVSSIDDRELKQQLAANAIAVPSLSPTTAPRPAHVGTKSTSTAATAAASQVLPAVSHEVALESRHRAMPGVLDPPADQLLGDIPNAPAGCLARTGQTQEQICRLGASSSSRIIVLLGDSHAQVWLADVLSLAQRDNWAVVPLIKEGCSPSEWMHSSIAPYCPPWFRWAVRQAGALGADVTLIAGHYNDLSAMLPGLDSAVRGLRRHSRHVVMIGDVPERQQQPVDCLLAPHATPARCSDTLTANEAQLTESASQLAGIDHVGFIDPTGWFCAQQQCPLVVGNVITYRDSGHITTTYATALNAVFRQAFYLAINQRRPAP